MPDIKSSAAARDVIKYSCVRAESVSAECDADFNVICISFLRDMREIFMDFSRFLFLLAAANAQTTPRLGLWKFYYMKNL